MSSSRHGKDSHGSKNKKEAQRSVRKMIDSLRSHRINTLTELVRMERIAATCSDEGDAQAFQGPMTEAWEHYVASHQLLSELRGLTRNYPICGAVVADAQARVRNDPDSNRSWNMAWLCLEKMLNDNMLSLYASAEASRPAMWGGREPLPEEADQLAQCFEYEWNSAITTLLRHWSVPPTWY